MSIILLFKKKITHLCVRDIPTTQVVIQAKFCFLSESEISSLDILILKKELTLGM